MKIIAKIFSNIRWWECVLMFLFMAALIVAGIFCKSGVLVIVDSLFLILSTFLVAKGKVFGNVVAVVCNILYCFISFQNAFYGEVLIACTITLPTYFLSFWTWLRNYNKKNSTVLVNRKIGKWEVLISMMCVAVFGVGIFWVLRAMNTANLIFSTMSTCIATYAAYLVIRRCEFNFICYLVNNVVCIGLWISTISSTSLTQVPTIMAYFMLFMLNAFGFVNWLRMKRKQGREKFDLPSGIWKGLKNLD